MKRQANQRERLLEEAARACIYCGHPLTEEEMEVDHIVPRSRGGSNEFGNKVCACPSCNAAKADQTVSAFISGMSAKQFRAYQNRLETLYMQDKLSWEKWELLDPCPESQEEQEEEEGWVPLTEWQAFPLWQAFCSCPCRHSLLNYGRI